MKSVTHSIFKTFLLSLFVVAQMHFAYAQTASILPPAKTTFLDANGKPLTAGTVESFIPSTTTHKTTWQDAAETIPNANPLTLDAAGRALLLGSGSYRQVVKDRLNNVIWDQVTSSTGSGGGGGSTATGDGDLVGTIKPWAGMTAPNQYVFTYGQELSRTTYSALFTAITSTQAVFCNSGSPILNGLGDTTNFWIGMTVELSCVAPGFTTVISKTATTVTLALNSNVTTNTNAVFFPWGRGNGSTTFNMPDFRGFVIAGNNIMGGVSGSQVTTTFFGATDPNSSGAAGGNQSHAIILSEMAGHTPTGSVTNTSPLFTDGFNVAGGATTLFRPLTTTPVGIPATFAGNSVGGGIAASAIVVAVGSGYTNGAQTITIAGGTCTIQPQFTVTIAGNIFTGTPALLTAGSCTVAPINPAATTGGGGTGGTLNVSYSAQPISLIQPTKTSNYIIKVTPDDNSATASGVTALGGMTGSIACGTGLLCTGNTISAVAIPSATCATLPSGVDCNNLLSKTANYTIANTDCGDTIQAGSGATGLFTVTLPAVAGFATTCTVTVVNGDTAAGKKLSGFPTTMTSSSMLWPGQGVTIKIVNGAWIAPQNPGRWKVPNGTTFYLDKVNGLDTNDCLATGAGRACQSFNGLVRVNMKDQFDFSGVSAEPNGTAIIQLANNATGGGGNTTTCSPNCYALLHNATSLVGWEGSADLVIQGNAGDPSLTVVEDSTGSNIGNYGFVGLALQNFQIHPGGACGTQIGIESSYGASTKLLGGMILGCTTSAQMNANRHGRISANAGTISIGGNGQQLGITSENSAIDLSSATVSFLANTTYSAQTLNAGFQSVINVNPTTWTLNAHTITGQRWFASQGSVISTGTGTPNTTIPGNANGTGLTGASVD